MRQTAGVKPFVLTVVCVAGLSCSAPKVSNELGVAPLRLANVTFMTDENGKPGSRVSKFHYQQKTLHFRASLSKPVERSKGRWIFTAKETSAGNHRAIQSLEGEVNGGDMAASITLPTAWPVGTYHVDVLVDEQKVGEFGFEVTGEKTAIAFLGHSLAHDNGKGLPSDRVEVFKYPAKKLHLQVTTKGTDTTEPDVVWRLFRLSDGKETEVAHTLQPQTRFQDSVLKCEFSAPRAFERGDYRADISISGKKAHSISFQIK